MIYKKLTTTLVAALFMMSFLNTSFAYDPIIKTNWGNSMIFFENNNCIEILNDDLLRIRVFVKLGDNHLTNYPDLFLRYNFDNLQEGYAQILTQDLTYLEEESLEAGHNLFQRLFTFIIDVSSISPAVEPFSQDFLYSLSLVTPNGSNNFSPYPMDLSNIEQLFPEQVFGNTYSFPSNESKILCWPENWETESEPIRHGLRQAQGTTIQEVVQKKASFSTASAPQVEVYPNPFENVLHIQLGDETYQDGYISISDITGKEIRREKISSAFLENERYTISTDHWNKGVYIVSIFQDELRTTYKVIK